MKRNKKVDSENLSEDEVLYKRMKKKKCDKTLLIVIWVLGILLAIFAAVMISGRLYAKWISKQITYADDESYEFDASADEEAMELSKPEAPVPDEIPPYEVIEDWYDGETVAQEYEDEVLNILLIGADTLDGKHARSDTMILMSINPVKKRIVFTSFMRDSYLEIPGYNYNRLNSAHSKGGPDFLIETLEYNFGVDIDFYAKVDFTSFKEAVDVIGGITLTVNDVNYSYFIKSDKYGLSGLTQAEACDGTHTVHLNGEEALVYARVRKGYGDDFGRTQRQRDFLMQFVNNCKGASFSELHNLLKTLLPHIVTNMPQEEVESQILEILTYVSYDVNEARVPCAGSWANYTTSSGAAVLNINVSANAKYIKAIIYG